MTAKEIKRTLQSEFVRTLRKPFVDAVKAYGLVKPSDKVTHNMQQATRVSDTTAFFLLGDMIEVDDTEKLFSMPSDKRTEDYITGRFG